MQYSIEEIKRMERDLKTQGYWIGTKFARKDIIIKLYENRKDIPSSLWNEYGNASISWDKQSKKLLNIVYVNRSKELSNVDKKFKKNDVLINENDSLKKRNVVYALETNEKTSNLRSGFPLIEYVVKKGDNTWRLAKMFYCREKEILDLNGLKSKIIYPGQVLKIKPATIIDTKFNPEKIIYSYLLTREDIESEDPLSIIAARFSGSQKHEIITAEDIKALNNIDGKNLRVGQHIWVGKVTIEGKSASWYGKDFHGKKMANGQNYDMNKISCASRDLPIGTKIKITNVRNNRSVSNVPVLDRGPYFDKETRAIDLSYEAARQLNMIEEGVSPVIITIQYLPKMPDLPLTT